jgi:hypothetical protein
MRMTANSPVSLEWTPSQDAAEPRASLSRERASSTIFSVCLGVAVFLIRALTSGPAYYQDAPRHLRAIADHTYVIQAPGYWLFTRVGGLFANPELGLSILNWSFSALGCVVFYACGHRLVRSPLAELGAVLYATIFSAWFSGDIQTTYASQLLFAPLAFYLMLRFRDDSRNLWLICVAACFSLGAGLRPSDGVFLLPLLVVFALKLDRRRQMMLVALSAVLCACWLIPNEIAMHRYQFKGDLGQLSDVAQGAILLGRVNAYTASNAIRFFLALALGLGPSAVFLFQGRGEHAKSLWIWVLPGSAFFLLLFLSDALYLDCLLGGFVLLCLLGMNRSKHPRVAVAALTVSIALNAIFFLGFLPLQHRGQAFAILNKDLGNFSLYGIRHQYWISHLGDVPSFKKP